MATLSQPLKAVLQKLATLNIVNSDGDNNQLYTRIWNNQIRYELDGQLANFPRPAAFVEILSPATFEVLGQGFRSVDINFRIHLTHNNYNNEGTFEQDMEIFELRDKVITLLTAWKPVSCSPMNAMSEQQDFEHSNVYHYIIDFVCNFTDDAGQFPVIEEPVLTQLEIDVNI